MSQLTPGAFLMSEDSPKFRVGGCSMKMVKTKPFKKKRKKKGKI